MLQPEKRKSRAITDIKRQGDALLLYSDYGCLKLTPKNETIISVAFSGREIENPPAEPGFIAVPNYSHWDYEDLPNTVTLRTNVLTVEVAKNTGSLRYYRDGRLLLAERDYESRVLDEFDSSDKKLYRTQLHLNWQDDEALFGLGQSPEGTLSLRGTTQYLHQANMKIAVPFLVSTKGYGLLLSTGSPAIFHDTAYGSYLQTEADIVQGYYFIAGDNYSEIIKGYRFLTGKAVMLPKWAFGYMQSQERYETADELIKTAKEYRRRGIGLDCIILDWMSWEDGQWGQKSFDPQRFPDPAAMMKELHALDTRLMISVWPNMHSSTRNYAEFKERGLLFPCSDIYDAFNEDARKLYWKQVNEGIFTHGIDAWWCDSSEPITPEWVNVEEPEPSAMYHAFVNEAGSLFPRELGNTFCLFHACGIYEGQRGVCDTKRVVNLTRSGYTGQQKYGTILWSGDISASWETLRRQIIAGLQLCACGLPYWTLDIGAFFVKQGKQWYWNGDYDNGTADAGYRELYVRWFQYGAFLPVFRAHGTDVRREVWAYGEPGEPFYEALCSAIKLRYQLMPYIYSLAGAAWYDDATIIRFLAFDFPEDENTLEIGDQYMFGNALMVCPVTTPAESARLSRRVYLPKGCDWYDFWNNKKYQGGTWINAKADIDRIPLFVREGSIIPMEDAVRVYTGANGEFTLYEDNGDGYGYESGEYRLTKLFWNDDAGVLVQTITHDGNVQSSYGIKAEIIRC